SFPSGHASGIASAAGVVIVLATLLARRRDLRRGLLWLALALVVLVGADRLLLGVHNISDVVAGYAVGAFWVLLWTVLYDPAPATGARKRKGAPTHRDRPLAVVLNPAKVEDVGGFKELVEQMA